MSKATTYHQLVVVVALVEHKGDFLTIRRYDPEHTQWHHRWEFPGGKIELNETPIDALRREVLEETSLSIHSEKLLGVHTHHWDTPKGIQQTFILLYHCKSDSKEVRLSFEENNAYAWEKMEEVMKRPDLLDGNKEMLQNLYISKTNRMTRQN